MATGRKRSKCVSWAPDLNLCQVRLFLSEDAPALSGLASQDHLQTKTSWLWHSNGVISDDSLPPGFEARPPSYQLQKEIAQIPLIAWQYPLKLNLNPEWLVVSGEESSEVAFQDQRQLAVLEAIYPRPSSIPPNPFTPEPGDTSYNDDEIPIVPITAIEEEDPEPSSSPSLPVDSSTSGLAYATRSSTNPVAPQNIPNFSHASMKLQASNATRNAGPSPAVSGSIPGVEPDIAAAAFAAFTAMVKSSNADSMIDRELLVEILSDPKMVEKLLSEYGTSKQISQPLAMVPPPLTSATSSAIPLPPPQPPMVQVNRALPEPPRYLPLPLNPWSGPTEARTPINDVPATIPPKDLKGSIKQQEVKNMTYYKNLIQRHGGDRLDAMDPNPPIPIRPHDNRESNAWNNNSVLMGRDLEGGGGGGRGLKREFRQKFAKPCVYFNTPRGCKHGFNCMFQHDPSSVAQQIDGVGRGGGKRTRFDRDSS